MGNNKNNFSKQKIVEQISKYISKPKIIYLKKGVDKKRDYRVDFKKYKITKFQN